MHSAAVGPVQVGCERSERFRSFLSFAVSTEQLWLLTRSQPKLSLLLKHLSNGEPPWCQQMLGEDHRAHIKDWLKPSGIWDGGQQCACVCLYQSSLTQRQSMHVGTLCNRRQCPFLNPLIWHMDRVYICPQQSEGGVFLSSCSKTIPSSHPSIPGTSTWPLPMWGQQEACVVVPSTRTTVRLAVLLEFVPQIHL